MNTKDLIKEVEKYMLDHSDELYLSEGDIVIKAEVWKKIVEEAYKYSILKSK